MSNLLKIKVMDDCPDRESVLEYYNALSENGNFYRGDCGIDLIFTASKRVHTDAVTKIGLGIQCEMIKTKTKSVTEYNPDANVKRITRSIGGGDKSKGYMLVPRSSISSTPLSMANSIGIIDAGYRGELIVPVRCHKDINHSTTCLKDCAPWYQIEKGQRLFQIVAFDGEPIRVEVVDKLSESQRAGNGFGSTNTNS